VAQSLLDNTANLVMVLVFGVAALGVVSSAVVRAIKAREEAALKARLIERGASAEEIERILGAGDGKNSGKSCGR
jgi:ABC-type lipoprotein release transport system permease subunit